MKTHPGEKPLDADESACAEEVWMVKNDPEADKEIELDPLKAMLLSDFLAEHGLKVPEPKKPQ